MRRTLLVLAAAIAASTVCAQSKAPVPPTAPPLGPPGASAAPKPRYDDVVHPFELRPGDRVRVWDGEGVLLGEDGTVVGADTSGIAATLDGRVRLLRFEELSALQMRRGGRPVGRGALVGLLAAWGAYALWDESSDEPARDFLIFSAAGAAAGGAVGYAAFAPDWRPVSVIAAPTGPDSPEIVPEARWEPALGEPIRPRGLRLTLRF